MDIAPAASEGQMNTEKSILAAIAKLEAAVKHLASQPFGVYMGDDLVLTQTLDGLRFFVPASDAIMAPKMIGNRVWEPRVTSFIKQALKGGDFIDVGANIGYFSVVAAMLLSGGKGSVHAFEPNPYIFELLRKNVSINWSLAPIRMHNHAIGARRETLHLTIPNRTPSNATLIDKGSRDGDQQISVPVIPLHEVDIPFERVSMMKIDVEGAEPAVLAGSADLLRAHDIDLVLEWDVVAQNYVPDATAQTISLLRTLGYSAWIIERTIEPVEDLGRLGYKNLFLTKKPHLPT